MTKPKQLPEALQGGFYKNVYEQTSDEFQKEVSYQQFAKLTKDFFKNTDTIELQSTMTLNSDSQKQMVWADKNQKGMIAIFDQNTIIGLQFLLLERFSETDETFTKTRFSLPSDEKLFIFWGGTNVLVNYHYAHDNQRYAFDFIVAKDNYSYFGDPAKNESYHIFDTDVLAPADGKIVTVENDVPDNEPVGEMNEKQPAGNYIIIDHGNDEYSMLAHFKQHSIKVAPGDVVKNGDLLGKAGNSGNSSEPHIHFQVGDNADLYKTKSIRVKFDDDYHMLQGETVQRGK